MTEITTSKEIKQIQQKLDSIEIGCFQKHIFQQLMGLSFTTIGEIGVDRFTKF